MDPQGADAELITAAPIRSLGDVIADKPIAFRGQTAKLRIEPGAFRIVDVGLATHER